MEKLGPTVAMSSGFAETDGAPAGSENERRGGGESDETPEAHHLPLRPAGPESDWDASGAAP